MANEMLDSTDVMRQLFGEREGLTHQTRNTLPQSIVEALDVIGFACFLCNGFVPVRRDHSRVGVILIRMKRGLFPVYQRNLGPEFLRALGFGFDQR
jgi:hypothetical protein